jgi:hypothetical protein
MVFGENDGLTPALILAFSPEEKERQWRVFGFADDRPANPIAGFFKVAAENSPSSGGLELLGKQRKEFARGEGPLRAERAGASASLGRGEDGR